MSPARATPPSISVFLAGAGARITRYVPAPQTGITNGQQLIAMFTGSPSSAVNLATNVGPVALLVAGGNMALAASYPVPTAASTGVLANPVLSGETFWRIDNPSHGNPNVTPFTAFWSSGSQPYVYNNSGTNYGGIVPAGGQTIDGYFYAAGTYVFQFMDFAAGGSFYMTDFPSPLLFRGCRFRTEQSAPGVFNMQGSTQNLALHYSDGGWLSAADVMNDPAASAVIFDFAGAAINLRILRCYMSYATTLVQPNVSGYADIIENFGEKSIISGSNHNNGMCMNGGSNNCGRILRNNIVLASPDENGNALTQTDCWAFFEDFGTYPGTGTNPDGTTGYFVQNNYVGGTGYCFYLASSVGTENEISNLTFSGNLVTTSVFANGGSNGPLANAPTWGSQGNTKANNLWADGPSAGTAFV